MKTKHLSSPSLQVYEAFIIYEFFQLCVQYLGGELEAEALLATKPDVPFVPFSWCSGKCWIMYVP